MLDQEKRDGVLLWTRGALLTSFLLWQACSSNPPSNFQDGLSGVVKNSSGELLTGASVKIRDQERGITFMVISQEGGHYQAPDLAPARYSVQAFGAAMQSESQAVEITDGHPVGLDLVLTKPQKFPEAMTSADFAKFLPEGPGKKILVGSCTDCHGLNKVVPERRSRDNWQQAIDLMRNNPYGLTRSVTLDDDQAGTVVEYLAKHFGPDHPPLTPDNMPIKLLTGPATKYMAMEFSLEPGRGPHDVGVDSRGICWVGEGRVGDSGGGILGRFDPETMTYTRIPIPGENTLSASALTVDPQDRVWFSDSPNQRVVQYDPESNLFTSYPLPKPPMGRPGMNTIVFHPDGSVWMTELSANQILRLDPETKEVTEYKVPTSREGGRTVNPYGMAVDAKGMVWFTERYSSKVGRMDPETEQIVEFDTPTPNAHLRRMSVDNEGNIWFGQSGGSNLAMIDHLTNAILEFPTPTNPSGPYSASVESSGRFVWVNQLMADQLARFDVRTKTFVEYPLPTTYASVRKIAVDPSRPGRAWYTGFHIDTIGYIQVLE